MGVPLGSHSTACRGCMTMGHGTSTFRCLGLQAMAQVGAVMEHGSDDLGLDLYTAHMKDDVVAL